MRSILAIFIAHFLRSPAACRLHVQSNYSTTQYFFILNPIRVYVGSAVYYCTRMNGKNKMRNTKIRKLFSAEPAVASLEQNSCRLCTVGHYMVSIFNKLGTNNKLSCFARPRRYQFHIFVSPFWFPYFGLSFYSYGKSCSVAMSCAYAIQITIKENGLSILRHY